MAREGRQHLAVAAEAGHGRFSFVSVLAGLISAYGAFAIIAAIVGAVLSSLDVHTEFRTNDWTSSGAVAGLATAASLLLAYLFGGYVAGRMARRSAVLHGVAVFVGSLVLIAVVSGVVALLTDDAQIRDNLRSVGLPTTWGQVTDVATVGVIVSLVAMAVGAIGGAILGEGWHTRLAHRVADPSVGRSAAIRETAERDQITARADVDADEVTRRDAFPEDGPRSPTVDLTRPRDDGRPIPPERAAGR